MQIPESFSFQPVSSVPADGAALNPRKPVPIAASKSAVAALVVLTVALFVEGLKFINGWNLVGMVVTLTAFLVALGIFITRDPLGVLVNAHNLMSLSRFQMAVWTIVVIASVFCYALIRIQRPEIAAEALKIEIPQTLLTLMGISAGSFLGSPLILGTKKDKEPEPETTIKTAMKGGESPAEVEDNRVGTLYANTNLADARFTDLFQGDEVGNTLHIDLAKVQMFFFTLIVAGAYLAKIFATLRDPHATLSALPELDSSIVVALGISHAGYLGSKAIDHTPIQK